MNKSILMVVTATLLMQATPRADTFPLVHSPSADVREKWAARELSTFLGKIYKKDTFPIVTTIPDSADCIMIGTREHMPELKPDIDPLEVDNSGGFVVKRVKKGTQQMGVICGNDSRGVLDGVYSLLDQKLGYGFYLHCNASENADKGSFSFDKWDFADSPVYSERVVFNWYNFISGVSAWNLEDYKKWIRQSARMRYTSVMLHAYAWSPLTEFSYNGETKNVEYLQNTAYGSYWQNRHAKDVRCLIGGELLSDEGPIFGADASKIGYGGVTKENRVAKAKDLLREVVDYAKNTVGMEFNWSFDIDTTWAHPQNIITKLKPESRFKIGNNWIARPDTKDGYAYYKNMIKTVMTDYPGISTITIWWRHKNSSGFGGLVNTMKSSELPAEWQKEYNDAPENAKKYMAPAMLYYAKVTNAFRQALDELGYNDTELAYGSWWMNETTRHEMFMAADYFQDKALTAYVLDYDMAFDESSTYRAELAQTGSNRRLNIIQWAHHDDGKYMGRPYTPPTDFADKLKESKVSGFGIIHWTTRPLDIFFKSLQNQTWSHTINEDLKVTCRKMAEDYFGMSQSDIMTDYLHAWITTAPQFGRETGTLGATGVQDYDQRARECDARIAILNKVHHDQMTEVALNRWKYFKGHEEWIKLFHLAQKEWDVDLQKETIHKFTEKASVDGGMTRGEEGLLIQHNIKWLKNPEKK